MQYTKSSEILKFSHSLGSEDADFYAHFARCSTQHSLFNRNSELEIAHGLSLMQDIAIDSWHFQA